MDGGGHVRGNKPPLGLQGKTQSIGVRDVVAVSVLVAGVAASLVWTVLFGWLLVKLVGARVMLPNSGQDMFNENWPYVALAALVAVFLVVLLWTTLRTSRRVRKLESRVQRLRSDVAQLNQIEERQLLEKIKAKDVSIVPAASADERRDNLAD